MKKSTFQETLGNYPQIKVLDFLIGKSESNFTLTEIHKNSKVAYVTLKYLLPNMLKKGLVIVEKKIGKVKLYRINLNNQSIVSLQEFHCLLNEEL